MNKHLFICDMEKCGTTALALWFVKQNLAEFLVLGVKELSVYSAIDFARFMSMRHWRYAKRETQKDCIKKRDRDNSPT